jgi:flagellar basal-body rod protein FlgC
MGNNMSPMDISASALAAQRMRMKVISGNIANANTMMAADGQPYKKREISFATVLNDMADADNPTAGLGGVKIESIRVSANPYTLEHRPGHPLSDAQGYVRTPNTNITEEMVEMVEAQRAYAANLTAMKAYRDMLRNSLGILK